MHYKGIDDIHQHLSAVQRRRKALRLARGVLVWLSVVCGAAMVAALAGGYWPDQPPAALRWLLALGLGAFIIVTGARLILQPARWRQTPQEVARFIEQARPNLRNDLINAVLLAEDDRQASGELVQQAINESAQRTRRLDWTETVDAAPARRWLIVALVAIAGVVGMGVLQGAAMRRGLLAVAAPMRYVPHTNAITLEEITPGDVTLFAGQPLEITARIRNEEATPHAARVVVGAAEPDSPPHVMLASEANTAYSCSLGPLSATAHYAVVIGESRWPLDRTWYVATVIERVELASLAVGYEYPPYTKLQAKVDEAHTGPITAPQGTRATLTATFSSPVPGVRIELLSGRTVKMTSTGDTGRTFSAELPVVADDAYHIVAADKQGRPLRQFPETGAAAGGAWPIVAVVDKPPTARLVMPGRDVSASPAGRLATRTRTADDYGLSSANLFAAADDADFAAVHTFDAASLARPRLDYTYELADRYRTGQTVRYYVEVADTRNLPGVGGPQTARTTTYTLTIQDASAIAADKAKRYAELLRRLAALLKVQAAQRVNTGVCLSAHDSLPQIARTASAIGKAQQAIGAELADLATTFPFDQNTLAVQRAIADLAANEAPLAVEQAANLAALSALTQRESLGRALATTQDDIIHRLQTLLAVTASLRPTEEPKTPTAGADLPDDVREKLETLKDALEKFADAQKKLIDATGELAKKSVDDFTPADQKLLAELAAAMDKWELFLEEAFSDLSELAQQDFANAAMLKELLSIKTDVTMAKDALAKKAVELAVSLEESGAENAEALTTNLEKWLSDEPDRKKWSMEDPIDQANIEQAELPTELEDLVGDLLEEEEDLFDEIDDITSKWTGSFDKGAGWETSDGPISSMNAQGVTGNQLPNTSEISGRSGEGRTGKSTGEFVQDEAVGKGGRRTPTRLTDEPYQAGEVRDTSAEPPGGATGGGKLSGAGSEGLEGPPPPEVAKELERLAGQQAALINRAERLAERFEPGDYAAFRLLDAITLMSRVRDDLQHYRYRNALRVRHRTVSALSDAHQSLTGDVEVVGDPSQALPKTVRDDIQDAADSPLPAEYREELRAFYRRLAEQAGGQ
ncbi:MAG: hypothetical protein ACYS8X_08250 [Planctomycetota bacterium]|jgi:hypothetical protein